MTIICANVLPCICSSCRLSIQHDYASHPVYKITFRAYPGVVALQSARRTTSISGRHVL